MVKPKKNENHASSDEESGDEAVEELPLEIIKKKGKERTSVSAEVYGVYNIKENFKPRVIHKKIE